MSRLSAADRARLDATVKADDSPFPTFLVSPWSKRLAWAAAQRGLTPNQVTTASLAVAGVAAGCCASGTQAGYVTGALLLQASFGLDCADGQLARLTGAFSPLGAWLDATFDRAKEYVVYAGLALGASRAGDDVWALAAAALALQTARHMVDYAWSVTPMSLAALDAGARLRAQGGRRRWHWARKVAVLPIGERWALISLLVAVTGPRTTLTVVLAASALAAAYMLAARLRRPARPGDAATAEALEAFRDAGPVARGLGRLGRHSRGRAVALPLLGAGGTGAALALALVRPSAARRALPVGAAALGVLGGLGGRLASGGATPARAWLVPPALRAAEYALVLGAAALAAAEAPGTVAAAYAFLAVDVWHHYDTVYRVRHRGQAPPDPVVLAGGGFDARALVVGALAAAGPGALRRGLAVLSLGLGALFVGESLASWRGWLAAQGS